MVTEACGPGAGPEKGSEKGPEKGLQKGLQKGPQKAAPAPEPGQGGRRRWLAARRRWLGGLAGAAGFAALMTRAAVAGTGKPDMRAAERGGGGSDDPVDRDLVGRRLVAAWREDSGERVGLLQVGAAGLAIFASMVVPTRAHGVVAEGAGRFLAVARRPGDWLVRWDAGGRALAWAWADPARAFNGHVLLAREQGRLYTSETDLDSGAGLIGVRDLESLEKIEEWPTGGRDPHELVLDGNGDLVVANGGIPTRPETGRLKLDLDQMDSSLVRLSARDGQLLGRWQVEDRRLSLRHLAWHGDRLGIAVQAEHDDPADRARAPIFASFDGRHLALVPAPRALSGYGGSIATTARGWAVSCPRDNLVAFWTVDGRWSGALKLAEGCPLAAHRGGLLAGGLDVALVTEESGAAAADEGLPIPPIRLDNHWALAGSFAGPSPVAGSVTQTR